MPLVYVTITHTFETAADTAAVGRVEFTPIAQRDDDTITIVAQRVTAPLAAAGELSQLLAAGSYRVVEWLTGSPSSGRTYYVEVPDDQGSSLDLRDLPTWGEAPGAGGAPPSGGDATAADLAAHIADATGVHGIADTAVMETTTGSAAKVAAHAVASDPHGDRAVAAAALTAHEADTTGVHGIADTAAMETTTGSAAKVTAHAAASDPHADRAVAAAALAAHEADATGVHGIANTASLETTTGSAAKVTAHAAASDPHGDRAYTDTQVATRVRVVEGPLSFLDSRVGGVGNGSTNNVAAWAAAMTLLTVGGGELFFPPGVYGMSSQPADVPGGVLLRGTGFDYSDPTLAAPQRASVIRALAAMGRLITLSPFGTGGSSAAGNTGASMENLVADGRDLADVVVSTQGRRNYIRNCQVYWGLLRGIDIVGQNTYVMGGVQAQHDTGDVIAIRSGGDHKILDAQQRQPGTTGACIRVSGSSVADVLIRGNHMWSGANGVGLAAEALIVLDATSASLVNVGVTGNIIEGVIGPEILIKMGTNQVRGLRINDNGFFNADSSTGHGVIRVDGTGSLVSTAIQGNTVDGASAASPYKAFVDLNGTPSSSLRVSIIGNVGTYVANIVAPTTGKPADKFYQRGNSFRNATTTVSSDSASVATLNGDGSTTIFTIAHGLDGAPRSHGVVPMTTVASAARTIAADATNLIVTYAVAPVSGAGNVVLAWHAER